MSWTPQENVGISVRNVPIILSLMHREEEEEEKKERRRKLARCTPDVTEPLNIGRIKHLPAPLPRHVTAEELTSSGYILNC
jgi:hypothetical protein